MERAVIATILMLSSVACGAAESREPLPREWVAPSGGLSFVLVQPGAFRMGLRDPLDLRPAPQHEVRITRPFYLGRFEVTQSEWSSIVGTDPSQNIDCPQCPVESVTWHDTQRFFDLLEEQNPGEVFRLPTEAEWEYACRAGGTGRYGSELDTLRVGDANIDWRIPFEGGESDAVEGHPTNVGSFGANPWGLSDMVGNVWEWTADQYCPYPTGTVTDPFGSCGTDTIPIRGGSWFFSAGAARCGRRYTHHARDSGFSLGFRVLREVPAEGTT